MTEAQFNQLMMLIEKVLTKPYTLTGAADWEILAAFMGVFLAVIAFMWIDLRGIVKDNKSEWKVELAKHETEDKADRERVWTALKDCQHDCCPRKKE